MLENSKDQECHVYYRFRALEQGPLNAPNFGRSYKGYLNIFRTFNLNFYLYFIASFRKCNNLGSAQETLPFRNPSEAIFRTESVTCFTEHCAYVINREWPFRKPIN